MKSPIDMQTNLCRFYCAVQYARAVRFELSKSWKISAESPRAKKKEETRQRILQASAELFQTKGFYETTTSDIAKAAKVSPGSIYAHFGSPGKVMAELHKGLVAKRTKRLTEIRGLWPEGRSAWELLILMLDEIWGVNQDPLQLENVCAFQSWSWVCAPQDYTPFREIYSVLNEELTITTLMAQEQGTVKSDIDVPLMVEIMAAAYLQAIQDARISPERFEQAHVKFIEQVHTIFRVPMEQPDEGAV